VLRYDSIVGFTPLSGGVSDAQGTKKVRKFRLQNTSFQNVSFNLNKKALEAVGVKVEPDAIGKLPGAPDFPSVPVQVTFDTTAKGISMGPMRIDVPIAIKVSPSSCNPTRRRLWKRL
jgi:hypothetical protein